MLIQFSEQPSTFGDSFASEEIADNSAYPDTDFSYYNGADFGTLNINEETYENKLRPEEGWFCQILQGTLQREDPTNIHSGAVGARATDHFEDAELSNTYSLATSRRLIALEKQLLHLTELNHLQHRHTEEWKLEHLRRSIDDFTAERDLWLLLTALAKSKLFIDLNDRECDEALVDSISSLPFSAGIPDYINAAYRSDNRLRKGAVLREWCERGAERHVSKISQRHSLPLNDTLKRIISQKDRSSSRGSRSSSAVQSVHPDSQTLLDGFILPLDGTDQAEQESLYKYLWQLLRAGKLREARQVAADHRLYWLSSVLQGSATHQHVEIDMDYVDLSAVAAATADVEGKSTSSGNSVQLLQREGNAKLPVWLRTCRKLSDTLAENANNWSASSMEQIRTTSGNAGINNSSSRGSNNHLNTCNLSGLLEMAIYSSLSNNTSILRKSPLISTWQDMTWLYIKAVHDRDIMRITQQYRRIKSTHSKLYAGCGVAVMEAEQELLNMCETELAGMSMTTCKQIFDKVPPPRPFDSIHSWTAEAFILHLQVAIIEGVTGLTRFIDNVLHPYLVYHSKTASSSAKSTGAGLALVKRGTLVTAKSRKENDAFPSMGTAQILRTCCHLSIWLAFSSEASALADIISDNTVELAVQCYIDHLIEHKQRHLVATYCVYLSREQRIHKYAQLLNSIEGDSTAAEAEANVNAAATRAAQYDRQEEVLLSGQSVTSVEVLQLAKNFFPADVLDITRMVVQRAHGHYHSEEEYENENDSGAMDGGSRNNDSGGDDDDDDRELLQQETLQPKRRGVAFASGSTPPSGDRGTANNKRVGFGASGGAGTGNSTPGSANSTFKKSKFRVATPKVRAAAFTGGGSAGSSGLRSNGASGAAAKAASGIFASGGTRGIAPISGGGLFGHSARKEYQKSIQRQQLQQQQAAADSSCLQALRWLFIDREHRVEAVRQSNRLVDKFILESEGDANNMIGRITNLLTNHLPVDSLIEGFAILSEKEEQLESDMQHALEEKRRQEDAAATAAHSLSASSPAEKEGEEGCSALDTYIRRLRADKETLETEQTLWYTDVAKMELWRSFVSAMKSVEAVSSLQADLKMQLNRLVGSQQTIMSSLSRFRVRLEKLSQDAVGAISRTLRCEAFSTDIPLDSPGRADGFKDVWRKAEKSAALSVIHSVRHVQQSLEPYLIASSAGAAVSGGARADREEGEAFVDRMLNTAEDGHIAARTHGTPSSSPPPPSSSSSVFLQVGGTGSSQKRSSNSKKTSRQVAGDSRSNSTPAAGGGGVGATDSAALVAQTDELLEECEHLLEWYESLYSNSSIHQDRGSANNSMTANSYPLVAPNLVKELQEVLNAAREVIDSICGAAHLPATRRTHLVDTLLANDSLLLQLKTSLQQCNLHFLDVWNSRQISQDISNILLDSYLQVCVGTAESFLSLNLVEEACTWYTEAVRLSNLIASEELALQLYTLVRREDLQTLLAGVNHSAIALLHLKPTASILT